MADMPSAAQLLRRYYVTINIDDMPGLGMLLADDAVFRWPEGNLGTWTGKKAIVDNTAQAIATTEGTLEISTLELLQTADVAMAKTAINATRPDGRVLKNSPGYDVARVADGLIAEMWFMMPPDSGETAFWK